MYGQGQEFNENGLIYHDIFSSESLAINNFIDFFFPDKDQGNYILVGVSQSPDVMKSP